MIKSYTKEQRKQINTIMNVDVELIDEEDVVRVALDFLSQMCDPDHMDNGSFFYVNNDADGKIILESQV